VQERKPAEHAPKYRFLQTPDDAVHLALAAARTVRPDAAPYTRFVWIQSGSMRSVRTASLAANVVSRGSSIQRPVPLFGGFLAAVDLRKYAPQDKDLQEFVSTWEELAKDPMFSLLITRDELDFAGKLGLTLPLKRVTKRVGSVVRERGPDRLEKLEVQHAGGDYAYPDDSGRKVENLKPGRYTVDLRFHTYTERKVTREVQAEMLPFEDPETSVVRLDSPAIDQAAFNELRRILHTDAPVVEHRYAKSRLLTQVQDDQLFKDVFGGLYYRARGIKRVKDVLGSGTGVTDKDLFFANLGLGAIADGKVVQSADDLFSKLRSDQRALLARSNVTGKWRVVFMFHVPSGKEGVAWGAITGDIKDKDFDIGAVPLGNLLVPRVRAQEGIFPVATDMQEFALFNGDTGDLADEVPPDVADDTTIPAPYTKRLQPAISCLRCHWTDGSHGWKPVVNQAKQLLDGKLDVFGDLSALKAAFNVSTFDRLAGLYNGDFGKNMRRGREDNATASLLATGPWEDGGDQTEADTFAAKQLEEEYRSYWYEPVTPRIALEELGVSVDESIAKETFASLVLPDLRNKFGEFVPEDGRIAWLRQGMALNRKDWSLVYTFAAERSKDRIRELKQRMAAAGRN
jgi:hypothetical protein